jgi:hypothetical protein
LSLSASKPIHLKNTKLRPPFKAAAAPKCSFAYFLL